MRYLKHWKISPNKDILFEYKVVLRSSPVTFRNFRELLLEMCLSCKVSSFFFTWSSNIVISRKIKRYLVSLEFWMESIKLAYCRITTRDLRKTALYVRFLRQAQISILKILHVFLWLKFSPSLNSNINYHFSEVSI